MNDTAVLNSSWKRKAPLNSISLVTIVETGNVASAPSLHLDDLRLVAEALLLEWNPAANCRFRQ
ncbi:hypothetical protein [Mesorhizobium metallidurans]|uniref:hypothetical protein n=1 Tax=Mesorhizobium metallidurans TaxID=489722 RepID=UPI0003483915|nr:hypothetical protein [Mesorhizobium metallidurans]